MPGSGQRLQHLLEGGLHLGRSLREAELAVAVVAFESGGCALFALGCQCIPGHAGSVHLLVQQASSGKAVEHAVHGDLVDGSASGGEGSFYFGFGERRVRPGLVQRRQRPRGTGGAHARGERPGLVV